MSFRDLAGRLGLLMAVVVFRHSRAKGGAAGDQWLAPKHGGHGDSYSWVRIGPSSLLSVLVGNLVCCLVLGPVTLTFLEAGRGRQHGGRMLWHSLLSSLRLPLVWRPPPGWYRRSPVSTCRRRQTGPYE